MLHVIYIYLSEDFQQFFSNFDLPFGNETAFSKENNEDFPVNFRVHKLKITMPLRADIIVETNQTQILFCKDHYLMIFNHLLPKNVYE